MSRQSAPSNSPPRYHGLAGAISYGLFLFSICLTLGILGGVLVAGATGNVGTALQIVLRIAGVALIVAAGATVCRWASGGASDRLLSRGWVRGDLCGVGLLAGILLAGAVTLSTAPPPSPVAGHEPGEVINVAGPTLEGKPLDLAEYRGKVVLIDFWATWCPPCVAELPNVKATYDRYHADGFEVIAVSLDKEPDKLAKFVKEHDLPWPQIIFGEPEKRFWNNPVAQKYDVRAIPFTLLVDREGRLLAAGLHGSELPQRVADALGSPAPGIPWSDRLADGFLNLLRWMFIGLLAAPWWLVLLACWGGALMAVLLEMGLRRLFVG
jgi:thiol-disulfide isomerase/thioredoxin